jgi:5-methyltetrahydrofolate--homocysteine methyltransferase
MTQLIKEIYEGILSGQHKSIEVNVKNALEAGIHPKSILDEGLIAAMGEVGNLFEKGEYYVPEMLISARAMQTGMAVLKPYLIDANIKATGKVAIGTVKGDLHDIGKNLVAMMLEGAGFEVIDLGTDVPPEKFIESITTHNVDIIAMSALLTTTMPNMQTTLQALAQANMREKVKVIIGGAPVTDAYAVKIGADGYAPDASRAVSLAKSCISQKTKENDGNPSD